VNTLLEELPVLLGVGLGALATMVTTALNDRRQWKHSQAVRWDDRRFVAYTEYARSIKDFYNVTIRLASARNPGGRIQPLDLDNGLTLLQEARERRTKAWESVLLLGDAATIAAAHNWRLAVQETERIALDHSRGDDDWATAVQAVNHARDSFYAAARESLTVNGGWVAQAAWLTTEAPWLRP
jgi:hypothetical protein